MRKLVRIVLLGGLSLCATALAQRQEKPVQTPRVWMDQTGDFRFALNKTSREIRRARPEIRKAVLIADTKIIDWTLPSIETEFKKIGWENADATGCAGRVEVRASRF